MRSIFNPDGPLMRFLGKVFDLLVANLLWLICSIPIFTIGASTAALYKICFMIINDEDGPVVRTFFQTFGENFKQATALWGVLLGILAFFAVDAFLIYQSSLRESGIGAAIIFVLIFLVFAWLGVAIYTFALQMRFSLTLKRVLYNAGLFALAYIPRTVIMILLDAIILILGLRYMPLLMISLPALINSFFLRNVFDKHTTPQEGTTAGE